VAPDERSRVGRALAFALANPHWFGTSALPVSEGCATFHVQSELSVDGISPRRISTGAGNVTLKPTPQTADMVRH
jgi:hypothetical protein